jgi:hypothetical protein
MERAVDIFRVEMEENLSIIACVGRLNKSKILEHGRGEIIQMNEKMIEGQSKNKLEPNPNVKFWKREQKENFNTGILCC